MIVKRRLSDEDVRAELERILSSRTFGPRSSVHTLLSWLVERTLATPELPLKEYTIGVEAFGKPEGYDPQQDAYVRVQASKLRAKLQEYYLGEGASDPVRIDLPKRQFLLDFHEHTSPAELAPSVASVRPRSRWSVIALATWAVIASALLIWRPVENERFDRELKHVWQGFLSGSRPVLISLGTHQFYSYSGGSLREPSLDLASQQEVVERLDSLAKVLDSSPLRPSYGYTGTGQATGAFLLGQLFGATGSRVRLVRSSSVNWDDISGHNVIFLGSAKSNPQINAIPLERPFVIDRELIVNRHPQPGEPPHWTHIPAEGTQQRQEFALVSFLPGLHGSGEIVIIEAASTTGIWAGAMYLTDPGYARELLASVGDNGVMPAHYQAVLRLSVREAVPVKVTYEAHRVL